MPAVAKVRPALRAVALAATLSACLPALAADVYYMKVSGIPGDSIAERFEDWIEVDRFDWGVSISVPSGSGGGGAASGRPDFDDFGWQQAIDRSVVGLFSAAANGTVIRDVELDAVVQVDDRRPEPYFKMSFRDVVLTGLHASGDRGQIPWLDGSFAYGYVEMEYRTLRADGSLGPATKASYDVERNRGNLADLVSVYAQGMAGPTLVPVPEPETWALLLAGLAGVAGVARRQAHGARSGS